MEQFRRQSSRWACIPSLASTIPRPEALRVSVGRRYEVPIGMRPFVSPHKQFCVALDPDVTSCRTLPAERKNTLKRRLYQTGQLAELACVSLRTLRYYDGMGLLSPAEYTEAGYRLYTDEDLLKLQHILALKFLGFSLEEIKRCLGSGSQQVAEMLARQRKMMQAKRRQLDTIVRAIESAESLAQSGWYDGEAIIRVIKVIQMEQKQEWVKQYFSDAQIQKMGELSQSSYSEEARRKLAERGEWTE